MAGVAATVMAAIQAAQVALKVIAALSLTAFRFPPACTLTNGTYFDFIIIGGGGAGGVLANRLSANSSYSVLLIEAGPHSPIEADWSGVFPLLANSDYDNIIATWNDGRTCQNLKNQSYVVTSGKMLGGSTAMGHVSHHHGDPNDYNTWADLVGDDSWNYTGIFEYLRRPECLTDIDLLRSSYASLHGTSGPIKIARQTDPANDAVLNAAEQAGYKKVKDCTSNSSTVGICQPLLQIHDGVRQSVAVTYLGLAKNRTNLYTALSTKAMKVIIVDSIAIGVEVVDANGDVYMLYTNKEVILSAGALNSPKILMLSGVGPTEQLEAQNISVVANLSVGSKFQDSPTTVVMYQLENDTSTTPPSNLYRFPAPATFLYGTTNSLLSYPTYQGIILRFPHDSTAIVQIGTNVFGYMDYVVNKWYAASAGKNMLLAAISLLHPKSYGTAELQSSNYTVDLNITTGFYSDSENSDLEMMSESLADFHKIMTNMNGTLVDSGVCSNITMATTEYWECLAIDLSTGIWRPIATCAMGSVVNTNLTVIGVENLRVADASVMPMQISGNSHPAVLAIAERAADLILSYWGIKV